MKKVFADSNILNVYVSQAGTSNSECLIILQLKSTNQAE